MTKKTREPKKLRSFKEMLEMPANDGHLAHFRIPMPAISHLDLFGLRKFVKNFF